MLPIACIVNVIGTINESQKFLSKEFCQKYATFKLLSCTKKNTHETFIPIVLNAQVMLFQKKKKNLKEKHTSYQSVWIQNQTSCSVQSDFDLHSLQKSNGCA